MLSHFPPTAPRRRRTILAATCALICATLTMAAAPPARAVGSYQVQACMADDAYGLPIADEFGGWTGIVSHADPSHHVENDCDGALGLFMQLKGTDRKAADDYAGWKFTAPANTTITDALLAYDSYTRPFDGQTRGGFSITTSGSAIPLISQHGVGLVSGSLDAFHGLSARWLRVAVYCESPSNVDCPPGEDARAYLGRSVMTIADEVAPSVISADGPAWTDSTWRQSEGLTVSVGDFGSGISEFRVYVDGSLTFHDRPIESGGACVPDSVDAGMPLFHAPKPCPSSVFDTETIDTTSIPDGAHQVDLVVADASGLETAIVSGVKVIANHPPVNEGVPGFVDGAVAAQPHVGDSLQVTRGTWSGPELTYAVAWERCEVDGSACGQIPGATVESYVPTTADVGKRLRMAVTATNPADSVTSRSALSGTVAAPPTAGSTGGGMTTSGGTTPPTLTTGDDGATTNGRDPDHVLVGHVAGEPPAATCPQDRAALVLQGVAGNTVKLRHGRRGKVRVALTCAATGKAIAGARLDVATRTGAAGAVASQLTTDAAGHATLPLAAGAGRAVTIGYRMYADDPLARSTVTLRVRVAGRISIRASRRTLRNGHAVALTGALAGGHVPRRGVDLAVQWRDGRRWRPFAQVRTDRRGRFRYAYRFTRTHGTVRYALRVQVLKGQVDYPFEPAASKAVRVTVRP